MAINIENIDKSKLNSVDIFLKNSHFDRQIKALECVLQNFKTKKPLLEGLFQRMVF